MLMMLSLIISCLFGLGSISPVPQIEQDQQNNVQYVESRSRHEMAKTSGYLCVSPLELLCNNEFYTNFATSQFYNLEVNGEYGLPYLPSYTKIVQAQDIGHSYAEGTDFGYNLGATISSAYFKFTSQGTSDNATIKYYQFFIVYTNSNYLRYDLILTFFNDSTTPEYEDGDLISAIVGKYYLYNSGGSTIPITPSFYLVCMSNSWLYSAKGVGFSDYEHGVSDGYARGRAEGFDSGYDLGYDTAEMDIQNGTNPIYDTIFNSGKSLGDAEGYQRAISQGSTASTIFSGIVTVGLLPVNVFLKMFEYEVFGINIAGLVSGLFTIAIVVIIIRLVTGKKND